MLSPLGSVQVEWRGSSGSWSAELPPILGMDVWAWLDWTESEMLGFGNSAEPSWSRALDASGLQNISASSWRAPPTTQWSSRSSQPFCSRRLKNKCASRIKVSWSFTHPHVIRDVHVFLSSDAKELCFLRKTFQGFSPYRGLQWPTILTSKVSFSAASKSSTRSQSRNKGLI